MLYVLVNNCSVILGRFPVFLSELEPVLEMKAVDKVLTQGHNIVTLPVVSLKLPSLTLYQLCSAEKDMLTHFIPTDYSIHSDTIRMKWSILYLKGPHVEISIKLCISVPEDCFYLSKLCRP